MRIVRTIIKIDMHDIGPANEQLNRQVQCQYSIPVCRNFSWSMYCSISLNMTECRGVEGGKRVGHDIVDVIF